MKNNYNFNCWLAGLIEGDGTIIIPTSKRDSKNRLIYPHIRIAFHKKDTKLAYKIQEILGYGNIIELKSSKTTLWSVSSKNELIDLIYRLNGNMRTPKILRLHLLIDWLNCDIKKLNEDITPIGLNSWLSGMSDADSNFNVILSKKKKNNFRIQTQWRLEFSQRTYHGKDQLYWGLIISKFLETSLYARGRETKGKIYSSFIISAFNLESKNILINYLNKYPLRSSKILDYKDWLKCIEFENSFKNDKKRLLKEIQYIKSQMNNKREQFNWDHLNTF